MEALRLRAETKPTFVGMSLKDPYDSFDSPWTCLRSEDRCLCRYLHQQIINTTPEVRHGNDSFKDNRVLPNADAALRKGLCRIVACKRGSIHGGHDNYRRLENKPGEPDTTVRISLRTPCKATERSMQTRCPGMHLLEPVGKVLT